MTHAEHDVATRSGQLAWSLRSSVWLLRNGREHEAIHLHGTYLYSLLPGLVARALRTPYILFPLSAGGDLSVTSQSNRSRIARRVRRLAVSGSSGGLALAPQISDELNYWGLERCQIERIYNPVSPDFSSVASEASRAPRATGRTILFIGKLGRRKSPDLILGALAKLRTRWPNARALFVGPYENDTYRAHFEGRAAELGVVDLITVTGHVDDVAGWITPETSVFLLPSLQEGLPGALAEVLSCGIPAGVSDAGAMPSIVAGAACGRVLPRSETVLAEFVSELWSQEDLWKRFSSGGIAFAQESLTSTAVARTYYEFVERIVTGANR
ncbi:glycosyltransferase family 4 protein [Georgenia satyanarayanai]